MRPHNKLLKDKDAIVFLLLLKSDVIPLNQQTTAYKHSTTPTLWM